VSALLLSVALQRFWYIAPEDSIQELFQDPDFVTALKKKRDTSVGSYWNSLEHQRMQLATGGAIDDQCNGIIEIGFDFAEPYNFKAHGTGLMFMR
jgi:hypothetical protein